MTSSYVTYEDFERLQRRVKELEHALEQRKVLSSAPAVVSDLVCDFGSRVGRVADVKEVRYCVVDRCVAFYVLVEELDAGLLRKVARVEIALSRKYPGLSVSVAPVLDREEIPAECKVMHLK